MTFTTSMLGSSVIIGDLFFHIQTRQKAKETYQTSYWCWQPVDSLDDARLDLVDQTGEQHTHLLVCSKLQQMNKKKLCKSPLGLMAATWM